MYATIDDIKMFSRRVPSILDASEAMIRLWMEEAASYIHAFCSQDFIFEPQSTKSVRVDDSMVVLPKSLSGKITAILDGGDPVLSDDLEFSAGDIMLHYRPLNIVDWSPMTNPMHTMQITGDWGYSLTLERVLVDYANNVKIKYELHRQDTEAHIAADGVNVVTSPDATDLSSAITLLNELKTVLNNHFADTGVHTVADSVEVTVESATGEAGAKALAEDIDAAYLAHLSSNIVHVELPAASFATTRSLDTPILPSAIKLTFIRLVQRIAIRDDAEDHYSRNSGYNSETTGDGYSYNLSDGTLRNIIRPEDFVALYPYVNHGEVIV